MKKPTKAQREAKEKEALRQRIADVCAGACGCKIEDEDIFFFGPELSRIIPALESIFLCDDEGKKNSFLFQAYNLGKYVSIDSITDFYFEYGVRA